MARTIIFGKISLIVCILIWQTADRCLGERQVLLRDRLVYVLCDQIDGYLNTGKLPEPAKKLPEKYKNVKPLSAAMNVFTVVLPGGASKRKKREATHPILDLLA